MPNPKPHLPAVLQATGRFHEVERGLTFTGMVGTKHPNPNATPHPNPNPHPHPNPNPNPNPNQVGIKDPARPEVAGAIGRCRAAGIRVIMITGDSAPTASAIARDVGVFAEGEALDGRVFVGGEFFALPEVRPQP